jgi:hypothetical protein
LADFYHTVFPLNEAPISEGGAWHHTGVDWTLVDTSGGLAFGTQAGSGLFDDSYAYLGGFPPDVTVSCVIHLDPSIDASTTHEVEILLRWADATHTARGYECNLAFNGAYAEIVRWNGPLADFTYVAPQGSGGGAAPVTGDIFSATISGNIIRTFLNGVQRNTADITSVGSPVWTDGNPGMGFFRNHLNASPASAYSFSSYTAVSAASEALFFGAGSTG